MTPTPIATATLPSDEGPFRIAATAHGIVAAGWYATEGELLADLRRRLGPVRTVASGDAAEDLGTAVPVFQGLLEGSSSPVPRLALDLADRPAWDRRVLEAVRDLGWGETASYGSIARRVGAPRASRAVGGALGRNPISLLVPCHRVIAADGTLGGYGGADAWDRGAHLRRKQALLRREGVTVRIRAD